jgi:hypothetical protein
MVGQLIFGVSVVRRIHGDLFKKPVAHFFPLFPKALRLQAFDPSALFMELDGPVINSFSRHALALA